MSHAITGIPGGGAAYGEVKADVGVASGWAVIKSNGLIFVRSISDTRRAAIINWLVTEKQIAVYAYHTDNDIEAMWKHYGTYVDCRPVTITAPASPHSSAHCGAPNARD